MEYQLAKAGVFDDVEMTFAQKPAVEIKTKKAKEEIVILENKKAYNMSKEKNRWVCNVFNLLTFFLIRHFHKKHYKENSV
jgi:hypothetical protein